MSSVPRNVLLIRFHDGAAKPNWGGRATSLALAAILDARPGLRVADTINGAWLTQGFETRLSEAAIEPAYRMPRKERRRWLAAQVEAVRTPATAAVYDLDPATAAKRFRAERRMRPELGALIEKIRACDVVVVNGEGDFILRRRISLWRCLVLMALAADLGKPVHLVNTILSAPTGEPEDEVVAAYVRDALRRCASISFRDPESLERARASWPDLDCAYHPDALFGWRETVRAVAGLPDGDVFVEGLDPAVARLVQGEYVAIGGSSFPRGGRDRPGSEARLEEVIRRLRRAGREVAVVATCTGDAWMARPAARAGAGFVRPTVPLATGVRALGRAKAFLNGRYHPSILASLAGTPCVFMRSNSHKTRSLQRIIGHEDVVEHPFFYEEQDVDAIVTATLDAAEASPERRERLDRAVAGAAQAARSLPIPPV